MYESVSCIIQRYGVHKQQTTNSPQARQSVSQSVRVCKPCAHLDVVVQESCPVDDFFRVGLQDVCSKDFLLWGSLPEGLVFKGGHDVIYVCVLFASVVVVFADVVPVGSRWVSLLLVCLIGEWNWFKKKSEVGVAWVCNARSFFCQSCLHMGYALLPPGGKVVYT